MSTDTDIPPRALDRLRPVAGPGRVGQATAVEQSRAIAEVQAQVIVAQQMPRDVDRAVREMKRSCAQKSLAEKAFYRFGRGGQQVTGPSVQLAKELARCFGNLQYGIAELRRDDTAGESEMLAFAWDVETNTRASTTFIVPHVRDTSSGRKVLADARDIYENNANMGSRRQREMIFAVLPGWYTEDAITACYDTLGRDDGTTLAERAAKAAEGFGSMGVTAAQLVQKVGAPQDRWSAADLAQLAVIYRSLQRGETTKEDEFGASPSRVTAADITGQGEQQQPSAQRARRAPKNAASGDVPPPSSPEAASTPDAPVAAVTVTKIIGHFKRLGWSDSEEDRQAVLSATARLAGLAAIASFKDLTGDQADHVTGVLEGFGDGDAQGLMDLLQDGEHPA